MNLYWASVCTIPERWERTIWMVFGTSMSQSTPAALKQYLILMRPQNWWQHLKWTGCIQAVQETEQSKAHNKPWNIQIWELETHALYIEGSVVNLIWIFIYFKDKPLEMRQVNKVHADSPFSLITSIRISITMNVPVLPIPALKKMRAFELTCLPPCPLGSVTETLLLISFSVRHTECTCSVLR